MPEAKRYFDFRMSFIEFRQYGSEGVDAESYACTDAELPSRSRTVTSLSWARAVSLAGNLSR